MFPTQRNSKTTSNYSKKPLSHKIKIFKDNIIKEEEDLIKDNYECMIEDEAHYPVMRMYKTDTKFLKYAINVYKFYFNEIKYSLKQRTQTLHLAMAYFSQTIMR